MITDPVWGGEKVQIWNSVENDKLVQDAGMNLLF